MGSAQTLETFIPDLILFFSVKIVSCEYLMLQISIFYFIIFDLCYHSSLFDCHFYFVSLLNSFELYPMGTSAEVRSFLPQLFLFILILLGVHFSFSASEFIISIQIFDDQKNKTICLSFWANLDRFSNQKYRFRIFRNGKFKDFT